MEIHGSWSILSKFQRFRIALSDLGYTRARTRADLSLVGQIYALIYDDVNIGTKGGGRGRRQKTRSQDRFCEMGTERGRTAINYLFSRYSSARARIEDRSRSNYRPDRRWREYTRLRDTLKYRIPSAGYFYIEKSGIKARSEVPRCTSIRIKAARCAKLNYRFLG